MSRGSDCGNPTRRFACSAGVLRSGLVPIIAWTLLAVPVSRSGAEQDSRAPSSAASESETDKALERTPPALAESRLGEVYREACLSVVTVEGDHGMNDETTTGFVVGGDGLVATVFSGDLTPDEVTVHWNGKRYRGRLAAIDQKTRLALLKVDGLEAPALDLVPSRNIQLGQFVYAVTDSENRLHRALEGRLAGKERHFRRRLLPVTLFRIHLEARPPGLFGAPALDQDGRVVGVLLIPIPDEPRSVYALPAEIATKLCQDYLRRGSVSHCWLGLTVEDGTTTPRILECYANGPAYKAGLRAGDVILRIGDLAVSEYHDVVDATYFLTPGEATEIEVLRELERKTFSLVPEELGPDGVPRSPTSPEEPGAGPSPPSVDSAPSEGANGGDDAGR